MTNQYKKGCGYSYTEGFFPTICLLEHQKDEVERIYVSEEAVETEGYKKIESLVPKDLIVVSSKAVSKLGEKGNDHVIGVFKTHEEELLPSTDHVVMVNPQDMGNVGNAMRTMLAFGFKDLALITPCADWLNPKAVRASMGAFFSVRKQAFPSFEAYLKAYPHDYYPFVLQTDNVLSSVNQIPNKPIALVFGNEASGLPRDLFNENSIRIEESDEVDSLNLTTAIAVALHDFRYRIKRI